MPQSPIRTLVIDDDKSVTRLVCKILADHFADRLEITDTDDVQMALGMIRANQFDLCITDLDMPFVNGFKLLKSIKEADALTQVIILTGYPDENAIRSAFILGADDYLLKPISEEVLCNSVHFMLNRFFRLRSEMDAPVMRSVAT
jgi:two-component system response regulator YesN